MALKHQAYPDFLIRELPDPDGARRFYHEITSNAEIASLLARNSPLLADVLALAAWSPWLATTLIQNPQYLQWLARERGNVTAKTAEEMNESLARFGFTHSELSSSALLDRFRRREILRIYLHDIRHACTVVETTHELSRLADAVLEYAASIRRNELNNRYGQPLWLDQRGRTIAATFTIVALGKLGSSELNYASDIDLMFLYSHDGDTSGQGTHGSISNREYFNKLAEGVVRLAGDPRAEGAAYRIDLRLRPYGRDGPICCSVKEAARYYLETAQAWELQALIRARASAGSDPLFNSFIEKLQNRIFSPTNSLELSLEHVRSAKAKIDRQHKVESGLFNVKLGRGGIREIEFISQAFQLAFAGKDRWLHAPHTLISLERLADRGYITAQERTNLFRAYIFLRALEHRLQMENGLQTHSVPAELQKRTIVARRMDFRGPDALEQFDEALKTHTARVRSAFDRIFGPMPPAVAPTGQLETTREEFCRNTLPGSWETGIEADQLTHKALQSAAFLFAAKIRYGDQQQAGTKLERTLGYLRDALVRRGANARRCLPVLLRIGTSLEKSTITEITQEQFETIIEVCITSDYFSGLLATSPALIETLSLKTGTVQGLDYAAILTAAIAKQDDLKGELSALRQTWSRLLMNIAVQDVAGQLSLEQSNRLQTDLAVASVEAAYLHARREMARRSGELQCEPKLCLMALGRLASGGMDYGSDLDLLAIYDQVSPCPVSELTYDQFYSRLIEAMIVALSSVTRDGYLYRVDLRMRPDGKNGPVVRSSRSLLEYIENRAAVWEWLAYTNLHAAGGDLDFGHSVEGAARAAINDAVKRASGGFIREETRRVRDLLRAKRRGTGSNVIDIKFDPGGMLDVYFAVRFLELYQNVPARETVHSTEAHLRQLCSDGALSRADLDVLYQGYRLLRVIDHELRLATGHSASLPASEDHSLLNKISQRLGYSSGIRLLQSLKPRMERIRQVYEHITGL